MPQATADVRSEGMGRELTGRADIGSDQWRVLETATTPRVETSTPFEGGTEIGAGLGLYKYYSQAYAEKTSPARVGTVLKVCVCVRARKYGLSKLLCAFTHTPYASEKRAGKWEGQRGRRMVGG